MSAQRPYRIDVATTRIDAIRSRVRDYEWHEMPEIAPGQDRWACGTDRAYLHALCDYWTAQYDWRTAEAVLNSQPQFIVPIDGIDVHYLHVRGSGRDGTVVLLTHGWPGSVFEFYGIIDRLAHPARHGGDVADGVDVVIPSLPEFGFSGKPTRPIGPRRIAGMWDRLMGEVLGYDRYIVQGGDWGAIVSGLVGLHHCVDAGGGCEALHINMYGVRPTSVPETEAERAWSDRIGQFRAQESAYSMLQSTKPQTLSYAMMDSPVSVAAWIIENSTRGRTPARLTASSISRTFIRRTNCSPTS